MDNDEKRVTNSENDDIEILTNDESDQVIRIFFVLLLKIDIRIIWNQ